MLTIKLTHHQQVILTLFTNTWCGFIDSDFQTALEVPSRCVRLGKDEGITVIVIIYLEFWRAEEVNILADLANVSVWFSVLGSCLDPENLSTKWYWANELKVASDGLNGISFGINRASNWKRFIFEISIDRINWNWNRGDECGIEKSSVYWHGKGHRSEDRKSSFCTGRYILREFAQQTMSWCSHPKKEKSPMREWNW